MQRYRATAYSTAEASKGVVMATATVKAVDGRAALRAPEVRKLRRPNTCIGVKAVR